MKTESWIYEYSDGTVLAKVREGGVVVRVVDLTHLEAREGALAQMCIDGFSDASEAVQVEAPAEKGQCIGVIGEHVFALRPWLMGVAAKRLFGL